MGRNIYYRRGFKAQVAVEFRIYTSICPLTDIVTDFYEIHTDGLIIIKVGYCWDFATGGFDTRTIIRGSVVHDVICQAIIDGLLDRKWKKEGDRLFRKLCREDGMHPIRVWYTYIAVDIGSCSGKPKRLMHFFDDRNRQACSSGVLEGEMFTAKSEVFLEATRYSMLYNSLLI